MNRTPGVFAAVLTSIVSTSALVATSGCGPGDGSGSDRTPIMVAVSIAPQADLVERIGGGRFRALILVPPGSFPLTHQPSLVQKTAFERVRAYLTLGHPEFPFEKRFLDDAVSKRPDLPLISCSRGLAYELDDPHLWLSARMMRGIADRIADALVELDPANRVDFRANAERVRADIDSLDAYLAETLTGCEGRPFLVAHPAWRYFARDYGLEQVTIELNGPGANPERLQMLFDRAIVDGIGVLFVEPSFDVVEAEVVAAGIGGEIVTVDPMARNWMNNLGSMARQLALALGCAEAVDPN